MVEDLIKNAPASAVLGRDKIRNAHTITNGNNG